MKPKTKKAIIIAVIVMTVAFVLWLIFRKTTATVKSLINQLGLDASLKSQIETRAAAVVAYANANPTGSDGWSKESIQKKADEKGVTYEQMVLIEAAYNLYSLNVLAWSEYSTIESRIKNL